MSTTSSEADYSSSDNEDYKPVVAREFSNIHLPELPINNDVAAFNHVKPPESTVTLTDQQLMERLNWCSQINERLSTSLKSLEHTLQAEWAAKEQLLDKVLEKEIGADLHIH